MDLIHAPPIVAVFRTPNHAEKANATTYRSELEHIYRDAHPSMRALNAMMDFRWRRSVADRNPLRHWHKGRIVRTRRCNLWPRRLHGD